MAVNSRQISDHVGIPDRTIRDWQTKGVLPKPCPDLVAAVQAILNHYKNELQTVRAEVSAKEGEELYQERVRLTRAQADERELAVAEQEGRLVDAQQVVHAWSNYILACRSRLLGMPTKLAYELAGISEPAIAEQILSEAIDEALYELGGEKFVDCLGPVATDGDGISTASEVTS